MSNDIKVSVLCTVYNHESYLRKCLDGFVKQKTDFKFEIIIHDDCSVDNSRKIIEEYKCRFPELLITIFQEENQYSKGVGILEEIMYPKSKGKYIAFCEGDDCWIDDKKLQKQYDYMEQYPNCSMCTHNTIKHDLSGKKTDTTFNDWKTIHKLTDREVFFGWNVHTTSYFIRREFFSLPKFDNHYWFLDYVILTYAYSCGDVVALPDIMSVYNSENKNGVTFQKSILPVAKRMEKGKLRADYLEEFNLITNNKFSTITLSRIREIDFLNSVEYYSNKICISDSKHKMIAAAKEILNNEYCDEYFHSCSIVSKVKFNIKYRGYYFYPLWKYLWKHKLVEKYGQ